MQIDMLAFKIFNFSILKQHINITTELADIKVVDTIVTGQVYGAHFIIFYPILFSLIYRLVNIPVDWRASAF